MMNVIKYLWKFKMHTFSSYFLILCMEIIKVGESRDEQRPSRSHNIKKLCVMISRSLKSQT